MTEATHLTAAELEAGVETIRQSPRDESTLDLIVRRPAENQREEPSTAELTSEAGLVGDSWRADNPSASPETQLTIMNARAIELIARDKERWKLAGDQLYIDIDLSDENLPAGTRLEIGTAIIEVTDHPHTGCSKFIQRFGADAMKFVNSPTGRALNLRGIYARVIQDGSISIGDRVLKMPTT